MGEHEASSCSDKHSSHTPSRYTQPTIPRGTLRRPVSMIARQRTRQWFMSPTWDFGTEAGVQAGGSWQNQHLERVPRTTQGAVGHWLCPCLWHTRSVNHLDNLAMEAMEENPLFFPKSQCWESCFSLCKWTEDELRQMTPTANFSKLGGARGACGRPSLAWNSTT